MSSTEVEGEESPTVRSEELTLREVGRKAHKHHAVMFAWTVTGMQNVPQMLPSSGKDGFLEELHLCLEVPEGEGEGIGRSCCQKEKALDG